MDWTIHALLHHSGSSWKRRLKANIDWKSQTGSYASAMDGWLCLHSSCIWFPIPVECSASRDEWWWLAAAAAGRAWKQPRNKSCALDRIRCDACAVCVPSLGSQGRRWSGHAACMENLVYFIYIKYSITSCMHTCKTYTGRGRRMFDMFNLCM